MKTVRAFPHAVEEVEHCWIPLADGTRLAARLWLPADADRQPVPAVVEYIPYRKRDGTRERDEPMHGYFAGHGYAAVRVDLRGSGESDGNLCDEYLEREQLDGIEVLRWVAAQPWCTGRVGMIGKSWGGFNALQIAARHPPELGAIITVCAADDRYTDDAHYMGGCLLSENLMWGSVLFTLVGQPPDPALVGDRWREMWLDRLEQARPFAEIWLRHQRWDEYWRQGSVCADYSAIRCPVYAVGGWADGYSNAVPRLLAGLSVPRKGLVGPWSHVYPHMGVPGPAIGFLQEAVRWWDHWLKDIHTGIMEEPMYRVWMQGSEPPRPFYAEREGRWVAEDQWPSPHVVSQVAYLSSAGVTDGPPDKAEDLLWKTPQSVGVGAGAWCGFGLVGDMPLDQREDDGRSLTFDSAPLTSRVEILGAPRVCLDVSVDRPNALLAVRLNDVHPDGAVTRVTYGVLNLTHRSGHADPQPLVPGQRYTVTIALNDVAHAFEERHRVRVSISTSYWPIVWPSPEAVTLTVYPGASTLDLPVRAPRDSDLALRPFQPAEGAPVCQVTDLDPGGVRRTIERDVASRTTTYLTVEDMEDDGRVARHRFDDIGLTRGHGSRGRFCIRDDDPLSATADIRHRVELNRDDWQVRVDTATSVSVTDTTFELEAQLDAHERDQRVFSRTWVLSIPRDQL